MTNDKWQKMRIAKRGMLESNPEPVAATVPLHLRSRIGRKALTELLVSKRPQTAVAIGRYYLKPESPGKQMERRIAEGGIWEFGILVASNHSALRNRRSGFHVGIRV
ncbi:MAG TPA: hypothetical protein VN957_20555 [Chthoniobacterales bacterium]|nr:hypothetical protein [Chthoniobacterales bacterium]